MKGAGKEGSDGSVHLTVASCDHRCEPELVSGATHLPRLIPGWAAVSLRRHSEAYCFRRPPSKAVVEPGSKWSTFPAYKAMGIIQRNTEREGETGASSLCTTLLVLLVRALSKAFVM